MKKFKKFTYESWGECTEEGREPKQLLVDHIKNQIVNMTYDREFELLEDITDCESPMEQLLAIYLFDNVLNGIVGNPFIDIVGVIKQEEITIGNKTFRPDFTIHVEYLRKVNDRFEFDKLVKFIIEVDGHEFHQKTKQQVERDNERQRTLQRAGYEVVRFSGTEIYHRPYKCSIDVKNLILSKCEYKVE